MTKARLDEIKQIVADADAAEPGGYWITKELLAECYRLMARVDELDTAEARRMAEGRAETGDDYG